MSNVQYLVIHKDHPISVTGVNSGAERATLSLAQALAARGERVIVAAQLLDGEREERGVKYWDLGESFDVQTVFFTCCHTVFLIAILAPNRG